jgi:hypothetical protein
VSREVLLVVGEDAHGIAAAVRKQLVYLAAAGRDEHERRPERHRQEAVHGHAVDGGPPRPW